MAFTKVGFIRLVLELVCNATSLLAIKARAGSRLESWMSEESQKTLGQFGQRGLPEIFEQLLASRSANMRQGSGKNLGNSPDDFVD
jgi:hypothetical protein